MVEQITETDTKSLGRWTKELLNSSVFFRTISQWISWSKRFPEGDVGGA